MALTEIALGAIALATLAKSASSISKNKHSQEDIDRYKRIVENYTEKCKKQAEITNESLDKLGNKEIEIAKDFNDFIELFTVIHNRPDFEDIKIPNVAMPNTTFEEITDFSAAAAYLYENLKSLAAVAAIERTIALTGIPTKILMGIGIPAEFYAAGIGLGSMGAGASTTAGLAGLSVGLGAGATGLASLGAGAVGTTTAGLVGTAAGGGALLAGTLLSPLTFGLGGLIACGIMDHSEKKVENTVSEARKNKNMIVAKYDELEKYLMELKSIADLQYKNLNNLQNIYKVRLNNMKNLVYNEGVTDYFKFSDNDKNTLDSLIALLKVTRLMCETSLVIIDEECSEAIDDETVDIEDVVIPEINHAGIEKTKEAFTSIKHECFNGAFSRH